MVNNNELTVASCIQTANDYLNNYYLSKLNNYPVIINNQRELSLSDIRMLKINKIVYSKKEINTDKFISVYGALENIDSSVFMIINGTSNGCNIYIGTRSKSNPGVCIDLLLKSIKGNFPGTEVESLRAPVIKSILDDATRRTACKVVSSVTTVPSMRDRDKEKFVQGLDKFIDTMQGEQYTAIILADPVSGQMLANRKNGFEELYSQLSQFQKTTFAYGKKQSESLTESLSNSFSRGISHGISNTYGRSSGYNNSTSFGTSSGRSGYSSSMNTSSGFSSGNSWSRAISDSSSTTDSSSTSKSSGTTSGESETFTIEYQNKTVNNLLKMIDAQLERIKKCEVLGVWDTAAYFIADDPKTSKIAANSFKSLMSGDETDTERSFVNTWLYDGVPESNRDSILISLNYMMHPLFVIRDNELIGEQVVKASTYVSGRELPILMSFPLKAVAKIPVLEMAEFGRNVFTKRVVDPRTAIRLGSVYYMGNEDKNNSVELDLNSFASHCFVTGSTGSGKSNTVYGLLHNFYCNNVPFLVIEPAKGEYRDVFGGIPGISVFSTNPFIEQMLAINPFKFNSKIHVLEHLDRLVEIFNTCWEMYAAMPALLKSAMEKMYVKKGWDIANSIYLNGDEPVFPTFDDLIEELSEIINISAYSDDTKGDYTGALITRVRSLTNGIAGQIFCGLVDLDDELLFDTNVIVDLSRLGSQETKSLIMGILVLKLNEYRISMSSKANSKLKHITVLEEAHNLLKKSPSGGANGYNLIEKSVEMITGSIAEMRTFGEGFIIVDQSPTSIDINAIKNTNTKIIMRLPEKTDCEIAGKSVGLTETQINDIASFETGVAIVSQNDWIESVLTKVDYYEPTKYERKEQLTDSTNLLLEKGKIAKELYIGFTKKNLVGLDIDAVVQQCKVTDSKKAEWKRSLKFLIKKIVDMDYDRFVFIKLLLDFADIDGLLQQCEKYLPKNEENDIETVRLWKYKMLKLLNTYYGLSGTIADELLLLIAAHYSYDDRYYDIKLLYHN